MDYELFHDESRQEGYWHGMLLVPITHKQPLLDLLRTARENADYHGVLSLKEITKSTGNMHNCADAWISIAFAALMSRIRSDLDHYFYLGQRVGPRNDQHKKYSLFQDPIRAKLIIFRERDSFNGMAYVSEFGAKVEITFGMGLKGGLHSLGSNQDSLRISRIHFDGYEHYRRHIDRARIERRLQGLREYCQISPRGDLIDDRSSKPDNPNHQSTEDCELLQLTDLIVGSFRSILSNTINQHHTTLVSPMRELIKRHLEGWARMVQSRWHKSLWMGQTWAENGKWHFQQLDIQRTLTAQQLVLPPLAAAAGINKCH